MSDDPSFKDVDPVKALFSMQMAAQQREEQLGGKDYARERKERLAAEGYGPTAPGRYTTAPWRRYREFQMVGGNSIRAQVDDKTGELHQLDLSFNCGLDREEAKVLLAFLQEVVR